MVFFVNFANYCYCYDHCLAAIVDKFDHSNKMVSALL